MKQIYLLASVCLGLSGAFAEGVQGYSYTQELAPFVGNNDYPFKEKPQKSAMANIPSSMQEPVGNPVYDELKALLVTPDKIEEFYQAASARVSHLEIGEDPDFEHLQQIVDISCLVLRAPAYSFDVEDLSRTLLLRNEWLDWDVKNQSVDQMILVIRNIVNNERGKDYRTLIENINKQLTEYARNLRKMYHQEDKIAQGYEDLYGRYIERLDIPHKLLCKYIPEKYFTKGELMGIKESDMEMQLKNTYRNNISLHAKRTEVLFRSNTEYTQIALMDTLLALYPKDAKKILDGIKAIGCTTDLQIADFLARTTIYNERTAFLYKGRILHAYTTKSRYLDSAAGKGRL